MVEDGLRALRERLARRRSAAADQGGSPGASITVDRVTLAAFLLMVVLAGGNSVGVKIATDELDHFWAAALRFGASGLLFALLMIPLRSPIPHGKALLGAVTYGVLAFGIAFGLAFVAIPMTGAGAGQLLLGLVPLLTLILAPLHGLEPFRLRAMLGSLVALVGVGILAPDRISVDIPLAGIGLGIAVALPARGGRHRPEAHPSRRSDREQRGRHARPAR